MNNTKSKGLRFNRECSFEIKPPYPHNLLIGLTNTCNHRCVFCEYRRNSRDTSVINQDFLANLLREAYSLGAREVGYYLTAEPFINDNIVFAVRTAHEIGYDYIYTTTNGALADAERMKTLFMNGLKSVKFSFNAGTRETYKNTHGRDDFDRVIENIVSADKLRKELGVDVGLYLSFVEYSGNKGQLEILESILEGVIDRFYLYPMMNQAGKMTEDMKNGMMPEDSNNLMKTDRCDMVFNRAHITAEGFLTSCCTDFENELVVADLNNTTLTEAWNCERFQTLRRWHLENTIPQNCLCYNCLHGTSYEVEALENIN